MVLQAWAQEQDACLEVRLNQDEDAATYFDTDQQTAQARAAFRSSHLKSATYANQGYSIKSAEWKKQTLGGRFLRDIVAADHGAQGRKPSATAGPSCWIIRYTAAA